jgi:hypothetical protein
VWNHSPDGFNWGYGGSGPSQLALAVLLELVPEEQAIKAYQDFKRDIISHLPQDDFSETINIDKYMSNKDILINDRRII